MRHEQQVGSEFITEFGCTVLRAYLSFKGGFSPVQLVVMFSCWDQYLWLWKVHHYGSAWYELPELCSRVLLDFLLA